MTWNSKFVVCPFYKNDTTNSIVCEGLEKNTTLVQNFGDVKRKREYLSAICCARSWCLCYIAEMLNKKYAEDRDGQN